jgi:hypothetical protein
MVTDIFIDGASEVSVQDGIVRINLVTLAATEKDGEGRPVREVRHRLIMSAKATTELHAHLEATLKRLAQAGIVTRREPETVQ